jgi:hypothetical protein
MVKKLKRQAAWAVSAFSVASPPIVRYSFATINGAHRGLDGRALRCYDDRQSSASILPSRSRRGSAAAADQGNLFVGDPIVLGHEF